MDDEEYIESLDDEELVNEPSTFPRRNMNGLSKNVPNALQNRSLSNKNSSNDNNVKNKTVKKNNSSNNPLTKGKGLPSKDSGAINKLKKKNKPLSILNRRKKDSSENSSEQNNDNNQNASDGNSLIEEVAAVKRKIMLIKIGLIAIGILLLIFILIVIIYSIAYVLGFGDSFSNLGSNPIDSSEVYYDEAEEYYKNLNKATEMYAKSCGIYLNRSYIHAVLTYIDTQNQSSDLEKRYKEMASYTDDVAKLMVTNCVVDYEIGGTFFNNLKNSAFLKNYYKDILQYMDAESLVTRIFEFAEAGIELASLTSGYISDNLKVNMGTCEYPYTKNLLNEGTEYPSSVGFRNYVMGTVYAEAEDHITADKKEFLKAFTIVTASYALYRSDYQSGDTEIWVHNGNCWQVSCDVVEGCHYTKNLPGGYGTAFTGPDSNGSYWKRALPENKKQILDEVFNEVFGTVMLNNSGDFFHANHYDKYTSCPNSETGCMGQDDAALDAKNGMGYKEIIEKYYNNYTLSDMKEDSYTGDVSYSEGGYQKSVVYYDQTDYKNKFCGLSSTISSDGCGVTSMAMILSTFIDSSYTPPVVMQEAYNGRYCGSGISGTSVDFFKFSASKHGLGYQGVGKKDNLQIVLDALKSGNSLVVAHMGQGLFTNGGHYIVLTKVNEKGQVYVLDSYKSRRTGWHDFNDVVVKQLKSYGKFHIITKR